jgi:hypothetical protein
MANINVLTAYRPNGKIKRLDSLLEFEKFQNCLSNTETVDRQDTQVCRPDAHARDSEASNELTNPYKISRSGYEVTYGNCGSQGHNYKGCHPPLNPN